MILITIFCDLVLWLPVADSPFLFLFVYNLLSFNIIVISFDSIWHLLEQKSVLEWSSSIQKYATVKWWQVAGS